MPMYVISFINVQLTVVRTWLVHVYRYVDEEKYCFIIPAYLWEDTSGKGGIVCEDGPLHFWYVIFSDAILLLKPRK